MRNTYILYLTEQQSDSKYVIGTAICGLILRLLIVIEKGSPYYFEVSTLLQKYHYHEFTFGKHFSLMTYQIRAGGVSPSVFPIRSFMNINIEKPL